MLKYSEMFSIFAARLVLEVFGGGGAIWGFSEAIGFRTPLTVWFWRPAALTFGAIFFVRWVLQILDYIDEAREKESELTKPAPPTNSAPTEETKPLMAQEYGTVA